ncbi:MAG: phosphoribosyltransferase family protein [Promethearchaeota archaeon]
MSTPIFRVWNGLTVKEIDKTRFNNRENAIKDLLKKDLFNQLDSLDPFTSFLLFVKELMRGEPNSNINDQSKRFDEIIEILLKNNEKGKPLLPEYFNYLTRRETDDEKRKTLLRLKLNKALDVLVDVGLFSCGWKRTGEVIVRAYLNRNEYTSELQEHSTAKWLRFSLAPPVFYPDDFNKLMDFSKKIKPDALKSILSNPEDPSMNANQLLSKYKEKVNEKIKDILKSIANKIQEKHDEDKNKEANFIFVPLFRRGFYFFNEIFKEMENKSILNDFIKSPQDFFDLLDASEIKNSRIGEMKNKVIFIFDEVIKDGHTISDFLSLLKTKGVLDNNTKTRIFTLFSLTRDEDIKGMIKKKLELNDDNTILNNIEFEIHETVDNKPDFYKEIYFIYEYILFNNGILDVDHPFLKFENENMNLDLKTILKAIEKTFSGKILYENVFNYYSEDYKKITILLNFEKEKTENSERKKELNRDEILKEYFKDNKLFSEIINKVHQLKIKIVVHFKDNKSRKYDIKKIDIIPLFIPDIKVEGLRRHRNDIIEKLLECDIPKNDKGVIRKILIKLVSGSKDSSQDKPSQDKMDLFLAKLFFEITNYSLLERVLELIKDNEEIKNKEELESTNIIGSNDIKMIMNILKNRTSA